MTLLITAAVIFCLYFMPTIIANSRKHPNETSILLLNLFLGWTLVGWVIALVWSASAVPARATVPASAPLRAERACPYCAETIMAAAVVCRFCGKDQPANAAGPSTTATAIRSKNPEMSSYKAALVVAIVVLVMILLSAFGNK